MLTWSAAGRGHVTHPEISTPHTQKKKADSEHSHTAVMWEKEKSGILLWFISMFVKYIQMICKVYTNDSKRKTFFWIINVTGEMTNTWDQCVVCVSNLERLPVFALSASLPQQRFLFLLFFFLLQSTDVFLKADQRILLIHVWNGYKQLYTAAHFPEGVILY